MEFKSFKIYFVGIGGVGMCGLAELLHNMGANVWGSDISENPNIDRLREIGVEVYIGHKLGQLKDADVLVYSSAISKDHIELKEARTKKVPTIQRAEVLAEIMRLKRGIAIGGSHGKTTTTSLLACILIEANMKPTIAVGGRLDLIKSTAILGEGEWLLAEADESDGSFLKLKPEIAVITNIDNDHMDFYKTDADLDLAFKRFAEQVPFYGKVFVCGDDERLRNTFLDFSKNIFYYGFSDKNDFVLKKTSDGYSISDQQVKLLDIKLNLPGKHNAMNACAACLVALDLGVPTENIKSALLNFKGVGRRFQLKGYRGEIPIYDDYAHHPTEITSTLEGFKEMYPNKKIKVAFQPHRYSRTQICWNAFLSSFFDADEVYLLPVYAASESPIEGIDSISLCSSLDHPNKKYFQNFNDICAYLKSNLSEEDVFVTFGAGDIYKVGLELIDETAN